MIEIKFRSDYACHEQCERAESGASYHARGETVGECEKNECRVREQKCCADYYDTTGDKSCRCFVCWIRKWVALCHAPQPNPKPDQFSQVLFSRVGDVRGVAV